MGHLEGCSGLAGLIKTVLMLENDLILPNRNFEKGNPHIPFEEWKLRVKSSIVTSYLILEYLTLIGPYLDRKMGC
jgi:acyl transferase domain-containing protein